jgi:pyruvate,water dikinase
MALVLRTDATAGPELLGGKAAALARLARADLPIPPWFVVPPPPDVEAPVPGLVPELETACAALCPDGALLAVRSSASEEDGAGHSFAGQLESFLFVSPRDVPARLRDVWRSGTSERVQAYRRERGLPGPPRLPSVLVQRMVCADVAGVAFGADPVSGRRDLAVVSAVFGLGTGLVSGECDADTWRVDGRGTIVERTIARKLRAHRPHPGAPEGVRAEAVGEAEAARPSLSDDEVAAVAALARRCGQAAGRPQDIEWAIEKGRLWLLQSRPITSLGQVADPEGVLNVWDNSNIAESYSGVTTPLTFSFARTVYEGVYREFCRMMGVSPARLAAHDLVFRRMLGLVRGRVYYNLLSWYRTLALLPGYKANRRFMEQMMGVKEALPDEMMAGETAPTRAERIADGLHLARATAGLVVNHFRLPGKIDRFYVRLAEALAPATPPLGDMKPEQLAAHYHELEGRLLTRWDAPLVNDFFAMIFFGVLRGVCAKWCGDQDGTLQNDLICGDGDIVSAEPARRLREAAALVTPHPALGTLLREGSLMDVEDAVGRLPELRARCDAYLERFGDRCLEELKLESPTLHDDPLLLYRAIGLLAESSPRGGAGAAAPGREARQGAVQRAREALGGNPLRRALFFWILRHARDRVRERENLRFERTRLFGRVRRIFVELGRRYHELGRLDDPRDVFYLEVDEALGFVDATATTTDLRALAALRRAEFALYREGPPPSGRFETRGPVPVGNAFRGKTSADAGATGEERRGLGCCPGAVEGRARVVRDPRGVRLERGEVLVAERTDPGWILLFPAAAGLVVEHGSLLSHSAIVARELGLPAVVSVPGATAWLRDGDLVALDGSTGVVRRLAAAGSAGPPSPEADVGRPA